VVVALGIALAACVHAVAATSSDERIVVLHGRGHKWNPEHSLRDQEGVRDHYRYVEIAVSAGDVHFGGWFVDDLGGMLILGDRATVDTARAWAYEDPAVQAGLLSVKVTAWSVPIRAEDPIVAGALLPDVRAILRYEPGPNFDLERTYREQREIGSHLAFLGELRERGRIALGGPLLDDTEQDGIYMGMPGLDGEALLVALQRDPAVGAGLLVPSTRDWVVLWKPTDAP
jgi:uncharacterized protein YciI